MKQKTKTVIRNEEQRNVYKVKNGRNVNEIKREMRDLTPSMGKMSKESKPRQSRAS
jgi:hypothetical protein